ncbi:MAG: ATP-binding cassette domain-containing protein [Labilithrix sp.]|nr:ATP-binding cassette domain-containing protein [Labilithrix sp.]MBX3211640.1 ATP-binding cassette domain-containing protein [Labilithrix sp.]
MIARGGRRRWLVPEVVQTSAMDCGPASLKALLEGHGISVSYGRLREACQTDIDGTSIDTLEDVAGRLGLEVEQSLLPVDHLFLRGSGALPALLVVRLPSGLTHFSVAWQRHGHLVQVMDPASGRRWMHVRRFIEAVHLHTAELEPDVVAEWLASDELRGALRERMARLGAAGGSGLGEIARAGDWRAIAVLDASVRMVQSIVDGGGLRRGAEAVAALRAIHEEACASPAAIPERFWTVLPSGLRGGAEAIAIRGAVMLTVRRVREGAADGELSPELALALAEPKPRPGRELLRMLREDGAIGPAVLGLGLVAAASIAIVQALLLRALLEVGRDLGPLEQRLAAVAALLVLMLVALGLELPIASGVLGLGRRLEARFRLAFLAKLPRLEDRYFASRPTADMAERSHVVHALRDLPVMAAQVVRCALELAVTACAVALLDPRSAGFALALAAAAVAIPLAAQPVLVERELRARTHVGAISRFYLDAMLASVPIRAHGAERSVRREHESLVLEWTRAARGLVSAVVGVEGARAAVMLGLTIALVFSYLARAFEPASALLLVYWTLSLPVLGEELARLVRQYPARRNLTLRLLEPLGAREAPSSSGGDAPDDRAVRARGVAISFEDVGLVASGHTILEGISVALRPGEHVAVVGASGAGKSSLAAALLGWHRASSGRIVVDGAPIEDVLDRLRGETAWIEPSVLLFNASLLDNLRYGADETASRADVLDAADLHGVVASLPEGLQTALGEGGALVSGGEGQRVRLGRAFGRKDARLVIMDEPFRGLDRGTRRRLLAAARSWFEGATLIAITHDVGDTRDFERVLVLDGGRLVEDDVPGELAARRGSLYEALLDAERSVHEELWSGDVFRALRLDRGRLQTRGRTPEQGDGADLREVAQ